MDALLLEPLKFYQTVKTQYHDNVAAFFEKLVAESKIDVEENHKTVAAYHKKVAEAEALSTKRGWFKVLRVFAIIFMVVSVIASLTMFVNSWGIPSPQNILWGIFCIAIFVVLLVLCIRKLNPHIRKLDEEHAQRSREAQALRNQAEAQMAPLNDLFDDDTTHKLITQVMPQVSFAKSLSPQHITLLRKENDYGEMFDLNHSVRDMLAGTLCENPFLFLRYQTHSIGSRVYTGSIHITWTERVRGSDGKTRTVTRSQTLTASISKPAPCYGISTCLLYGNQAAPDLQFSREHAHVEDLSDRALERKIERGEDALEDRAREATQNGSNFQEMANTRFEVLFAAQNRTNEVQFRVMYTPLAQTNTEDLLLDEVEGWGDDFSFVKRKRLNIIRSEHAQAWDMSTAPHHYRSYDVELARKQFIHRNEAYFKSVFFDFAPLLAVPAYQDPPAVSLSEMPEQSSNSTPYEYEVLANAMGWRTFASESATEGATLKAEFIRRKDNRDYVDVTAHAYRTVEHIEFVSRLGGDGRIHQIPIRWQEYIPVESKRMMVVEKLDESARTFRKSNRSVPSGSVYVHGLLAYLLT